MVAEGTPIILSFDFIANGMCVNTMKRGDGEKQVTFFDKPEDALLFCAAFLGADVKINKALDGKVSE